MSDSRTLILGTAGHIDHGKSTLVKALTGVDPDRLAEEKKRGITIELGFAGFKTPGGTQWGVVDVPGHEKFIRHMAAGASGIDVALLVVAADDGVMVQTREHIEILTLLGVERMVVALTKCDRVDPEWRELIHADVADYLKTTQFADASIIDVSAVSGEGLDALRAALDAIAHDFADNHRDKEPLRLPVDRVFTIDGAGTVVTGTLRSGTLHRDDMLELVGSESTVRVRSVQVHGASVESAHAGQRTAINVAGIEKSDIARGDELASPGAFEAVHDFRALLRYDGASWDSSASGASKPLANATKVHLMHGTRETTATIFLLEERALTVGTQGMVHIRTEKPLVLAPGDRFVIRSFSPVTTIGGGQVLMAAPSRKVATRPEERALLHALSADDINARIDAYVAASLVPVTAAQVARVVRAPKTDVANALNRSNAARLKTREGVGYYAPERLESLRAHLVSALEELHAERPGEDGFAPAVLAARYAPQWDSAWFDALLEQAPDSIVHERGRLALRARLTARRATDAGTRERAHELVRAAGREGRSADELAVALSDGGALAFDAAAVMRLLGPVLESGDVVRLGGKHYFTREAVDQARACVVATLEAADAPVTTSDLRESLGLSRRIALLLLEHFDAVGVTRRVGDGRELARNV